MSAESTRLRRATALDPNFALSYAWLARHQIFMFHLDLQQATLNEALTLANKAVSLDEADPWTHNALGYVYMFKRQYELAWLHLDRAIALNPTDVRISSNRALWLALTERGTEAVSSLDIDLRRDPYPLAWVWNCRGVSLFQAQRYEEAVRAFHRLTRSYIWHYYCLAADLGKDDALALVCAGIALSFIVGEHEDGKNLTDRALVLNPNLVRGWLYSGWTRLWLGQPEETIERVSHALRLSPSDPDSFSMCCAMAYAHFFAGRYSEALSWSERAAREKPDILLPIVVAAASNAEAGRIEETKKAMLQVLRIDPALRISKLREVFPIRRSDDFERLAEGLRKAGLPE
jgi:tetratricopeptide (TPR) repeat protein